MNEFSFKELYDVKLKTTYPMEINGESYEVGETLAEFDKLSIANFSEVSTHVSARGGYDNRARVMWDDLKEVNLVFSQGIFSKTQLAMFLNAKIGQITSEEVSISCREKLESDENGNITLSNIPKEKVFFRTTEGKKVSDFTKQSEQVYSIGKPYIEVLADYEYTYNGGGSILKVGQRFMDGYLSFEGKTRVKDDITGHTHTGIFKIPRLKLMSDLSIRLGQSATPVVGVFSATAFPVGSKGNRTAIDFVVLNDDLDSDM